MRRAATRRGTERGATTEECRRGAKRPPLLLRKLTARSGPDRLERPAPPPNFGVAQRRDPEALAQQLRLGLEIVPGRRLEQAQHRLDDASGGVVALEVDKALTVRRGEGRDRAVVGEDWRVTSAIEGSGSGGGGGGGSQEGGAGGSGRGIRFIADGSGGSGGSSRAGVGGGRDKSWFLGVVDQVAGVNTWREGG